MNKKKREAIEILSTAMKDAEAENDRTDIKSLGELSGALLNAKSKGEQKKLIKDFVSSHKEIHKLLEDTALVNSEAELALIELAFGAESVTEEERTDARGRKSYRRTVHKNAPDLRAVMEWLRNKDKENWAARPQAEPELEDTSQIEEDIYGNSDKA